MPIQFLIKGLDEAKRYLEQELPDNLYRGASEHMRLSAAFVASSVRSRIGEGAALRNISGELRNSIQNSEQGLTLETKQTSAFSTVHYAPTQETGAEITAKRAYQNVPGGPYLNIPIPPNRLESGVVTRQAKQVFAEGGYIIRSRAGNWIVMLNGEPQFLLRKSVVIPPRLGMMTTAIDGFNAAEQELPQLMLRLRNFPLD